MKNKGGIKLKHKLLLVICITFLLSLVGCSSERATMQDNLRNIANICMSTELNTNDLSVDYTDLHKELKEYKKVITDEAAESIYSCLLYLKNYDITNISSQSAYSASEYNDLKKDYWELDMVGTNNGVQGRVVLQLCTNEKGVITSCIVKSQKVKRVN